MSRQHLQRYVREFEGRHNALELDTEEQTAALVAGVEGERLPYAELVRCAFQAKGVTRQ